MTQNPWVFIQTIKTLIISSLSNNHIPHSSYAPFIENDKKLYIFVSAMAKHYQNLINNESISIMIIEDESKSGNLFARKRVTFDVVATPIERGSLIFNTTMTLFLDRFGNSAGIYENMQDFQLFELIPLQGRAVFGFGKAYDFKDGQFSTNITRMLSK